VVIMVRGNVVVTGASTGIGQATAVRLAGAGWHVLAGVRKAPDGAALVAQAASIEPLIIDVADEASIAAAAEQVGDRPLSGLVNNAGIALGGPLEYFPVEDLRRQLEVNVVGLVATTQAMLPAIRRGTGRIVNMGSVGGRVSSGFDGPYNASKFALEALTDSLRQELSPWKIRVIVVEPGAVSTPIWGKGADQVTAAADTLGPEAQQRYGSALAAFATLTAKLNRQGITPDKVAAVIQKALTTSRPRSRYLVGPDAHVQVAARAILPARAMDAVTIRMMGVGR
jgi:NAD(P)-dependent dehydrogenase (short-subunit alcohol dehydrogenase family)